MVLARTASRAAHPGTAAPLGYIIVTFYAHKEDGQFASSCPELGTASCGDSVDEALANIEEATIEYLSVIENNGSRERVFRRKNIPIYPMEPEERRFVPVPTGKKDVVSSVVLPLLGITGRRGTPTPV